MKRRKTNIEEELLRRLGKRHRRPPKDKGGSEPVTVEPDRPKLGEGGAAAALEFDEP